MDQATVAELQVLVEGVDLPIERSGLVEYAAHEGGTPGQLALLRGLPERSYETIDEVAETLLRVQPLREDEVPHRPREESGAPPGGDAYTSSQLETGRVRDLESVSD